MRQQEGIAADPCIDCIGPLPSSTIPPSPYSTDRIKPVWGGMARARGNLVLVGRVPPGRRMWTVPLMRCVHRVSSRTGINRTAVLVAAGLLLGVASLRAHHGLAAFDTKHTVRMEGTVTKFEWINPHAYIYADLKDENGKVANWKLEMGSLGMLTRFGGWSPDTVKPGDKVTVQGFRAKDGSPYMSLGKIWLPNGQTLLGAP